MVDHPVLLEELSGHDRRRRMVLGIVGMVTRTTPWPTHGLSALHRDSLEQSPSLNANLKLTKMAGNATKTNHRLHQCSTTFLITVAFGSTQV